MRPRNYIVQKVLWRQKAAGNQREIMRLASAQRLTSLFGRLTEYLQVMMPSSHGPGSSWGTITCRCQTGHLQSHLASVRGLFASDRPVPLLSSYLIIVQICPRQVVIYTAGPGYQVVGSWSYARVNQTKTLLSCYHERPTLYIVDVTEVINTTVLFYRTQSPSDCGLTEIIKTGPERHGVTSRQ